MSSIIVHKGRTVTISVGLGYDVSQDTLTSEIRTSKNPRSTLIATWDVTFLTDGTDGELVLTLDDSATEAIHHTAGFMDIKRISEGEPVPVFDEPLPVIIKESVTA